MSDDWNWRRYSDIDYALRFDIRLSDRQIQAMDREALEMLSDGLWLVEQAFKGRTEGPLTAPLTGFPIRA